VVFVGEYHDNPLHHGAQLRVIEELHKAGIDVAVGLEMFRSDSQESLDNWVAGEISLENFRMVFRENWSRWEQYSDIFIYARNKKLPMFGMNLSREIIKQVANNGFASLSEEQLAKLPVVQCIVDPVYQEFIRRALGKHRQGGASFKNFCEAQLLWDKVMAQNLKNFLTDNPGRTVIVLAGNGHAWKHGIPAQLDKLGEKAWRVLLSEASRRSDKSMLSFNDADYLLQGLSEGVFHQERPDFD